MNPARVTHRMALFFTFTKRHVAKGDSRANQEAKGQDGESVHHDFTKFTEASAKRWLGNAQLTTKIWKMSSASGALRFRTTRRRCGLIRLGSLDQNDKHAQSDDVVMMSEVTARSNIYAQRDRGDIWRHAAYFLLHRKVRLLNFLRWFREREREGERAGERKNRRLHSCQSRQTHP